MLEQSHCSRLVEWANQPKRVDLVVLAANCQPVITGVLALTGHAEAALAIEIEAVEERLESILNVGA